MNSTYWANKIMNQIYTNGSNEFWLGLSHTLPNTNGTGITEPDTEDYARVQITGFTAAVGGAIENVNEMNFPISETAWFPSDAKARYWVLFDGGGIDANLLSAGELKTHMTIEKRSSVTVAPGTFRLTLTDDITYDQ